MWVSSDSKKISGLYLLIILLNLVVYSEERSNGMLKEIIDAAVAEISRSSEQQAVAKPLKLGKLVSVILKDQFTISKAKLILTLVPIKCENKNCFKDVKYCSAEVHMTKGSKFANFKNSNCTHEKKGIPNDSKQSHENAEDRNNDLIEKKISVEEVINDTIVLYKSMKDCVIKQLEKHIKGNIEMTGFQEKSNEEFAERNITIIWIDIIRKYEKCDNVNMKCNIRIYFNGFPPVCQLLQYSCKKDKDNFIEPTEKSVSTSENTEKAMSSVETTQKAMFSVETTQKAMSSDEITQNEMSEETTKETVPSSETTEKAENSVETAVVITTKEDTTSDKNPAQKNKSTSETTENRVSAVEITQKKVSIKTTKEEVSSTERTNLQGSSTKITEKAISPSETTKETLNSFTTTTNGNENEDFVTAEIFSENMYKKTA